MCSTGDNAALPALGFPIRESTGQRLFSASPWLIAAVHALLRLLVPRHPPCALTILTVIRSNVAVACWRTPVKDPVIPVFSRRLSWRLMWLCAVFKDREEAFTPAAPPAHAMCAVWPRRALRSLKTQQHAGRLAAVRRCSLQVAKGEPTPRPSSQVRSTC